MDIALNKRLSGIERGTVRLKPELASGDGNIHSEQPNPGPQNGEKNTYQYEYTPYKSDYEHAAPQAASVMPKSNINKELGYHKSRAPRESFTRRLPEPIASVRVTPFDAEGWPSGLRRTTGNRVHGNVSGVRIPLPPPFSFLKPGTGLKRPHTSTGRVATG